MKKRIIIVGVISIILVALISNHENIYRLYKLSQIRDYYINELNGKFSNRTNPKKINAYERYHKSIEELNHYDITKLVNIYTRIINDGVNLYSLKKQGTEQKYELKDYDFGNKNKLERGKDIELYCDDFTEYTTYDITDRDVDNFNNGTFNQRLIEKLKDCLDYEVKNGKIEWQINSTDDKRIELPYNCYIDYKAYYREDNKEFKRAVDVIFDKSYDLNKKENKAIVKYESIDGKIKEVKVSTYHIFVDNEEYYDIDYYGILVINADTIAKATLGSHTCDKMREEESFREYKEWEKTMLN